MPTWLLKTEPTTYSAQDLIRDGKATWDGVKNPAAMQAIRLIKSGDTLLIYHTGDEKAIISSAKAASAAYEDPNFPGMNGNNEIARPVFDLKPFKLAKTPLSLAEMKADKIFKDFVLLKQARLSVMEVPESLVKVIQKHCDL